MIDVDVRKKLIALIIAELTERRKEGDSKTPIRYNLAVCEVGYNAGYEQALQNYGVEE